MQKIYEDACGAIELPSCRYIIALEKVLWPFCRHVLDNSALTNKGNTFLSKRGG